MWFWIFLLNDVVNNVYVDGKKEFSKILDNIYCIIFNLVDLIFVYIKFCLMLLINEVILWIYNL